METAAGEEIGWREVVPVDALPANGWRGVVAAPQASLAAIAARVDTPKVVALRGEFALLPVADGVRVSGVLDATLARQCVATLEPMEEVIHEPFEITFAGGAVGDEAAELELDEDAPEPLDGTEIDLAELLIQQLSLAMAPYPRKPDAVSLAEEFGGSERISPFEVLKSTIAGGGEQG